MQIVRKSLIGGDKEIEGAGLSAGDAGNSGWQDRNDLGVALDIGTTTVTASVFRLEDRRLLGSRQEKNRQTQMGGDVMMRLMHCQQGKQPMLQQMVIQQVEEMVRSIVGSLPEGGSVRRMTVVGNPCMCHIFAGQNTDGLAGSPFHPAYDGMLARVGGALGFGKVLAQTEILILPGIDAHVGADAAAMAYTISRQRDSSPERKKIWLAADIGTNAEMVLSAPGGRTACSVPAGPAFEGMEISCGMRGEAGAIAGVRFAPLANNIILDVLDTSPEGEPAVPRGICGSGLVDVIAQLLQWGLLMPDGYLLSREEAEERRLPACLTERLCDDGFVLYQNKEMVMLSREDIRQYQLAKAAVRAGAETLLHSRGVTWNQLDFFVVAGIFGGHIAEKSAKQTGLYPDMDMGRIYMAGNAAGEGAALALFSDEFRRGLEQFAVETEHIELAESEEFQKAFWRAMELRP